MAQVILCRECGDLVAGETSLCLGEDHHLRCPKCKSSHMIIHPELPALGIAHIDCDAFYASVEKRDNPELLQKPLIIGGGKRGVVAACCYIARMSGVRSAMPMYKALENCPEAVVMTPNMAKYRDTGLHIRSLMCNVTKIVEPLALDEAFLDLTAFLTSQKDFEGLPAKRLVTLANHIEQEVGITVSIGLSYNKLLAKLASDLDKPKGFVVIGQKEAKSFLANRPVRDLWGVGPSLQKKLSADGIHVIGDLLRYQPAALVARYGTIGRQLHAFAQGQDSRRIKAERDVKSLSNETTFENNIKDSEILEDYLWQLCLKVSKQLEKKKIAGWTATLKLKYSNFTLITRNKRLTQPSQKGEVIYQAGKILLAKELAENPQATFRLIGIGVSDLVSPDHADQPDLFDFSGGRLQ